MSSMNLRPPLDYGISLLVLARESCQETKQQFGACGIHHLPLQLLRKQVKGKRLPWAPIDPGISVYVTPTLASFSTVLPPESQATLTSCCTPQGCWQN